MSSPPFKLLQIDHVVLRVRDMAAIEAFYCDVLGCNVERRQEQIGLVQLRAGNSLIDLVDVAGKIGRMGGAAPAAEGRNMDHLCLRADPFDRDAIVAHLQAHGVRIGEFGVRYGAEGEGPVAVPARSGGQHGRTEGAARRGAHRHRLFDGRYLIDLLGSYRLLRLVIPAKAGIQPRWRGGVDPRGQDGRKNDALKNSGSPAR